MPVIHLTDRALIRASGPEAAKFLQGVLTCNVLTMAPGDARYGALLYPQGKILADFLLLRDAEESFLFDVPAEQAAAVLKRLVFHRLRAKLELKPEPDLAIAAVFGDSAAPEGIAFSDPRLAALGQRVVLPKAAAEALPSDMAPYEAHRVGLGIPKGGVDFPYEDTFPHEADMDQLGGVDFHKGCYVGQEVVSRMEHRTTPRNRLVEAIFPGPAVPGAEITAGEKVVGRVGSAAGGRAIASVRLDRATDAAAAGVPLTAAGVTVELRRPGWANFSMQYEKAAGPLAGS